MFSFWISVPGAFHSDSTQASILWKEHDRDFKDFLTTLKVKGNAGVGYNDNLKEETKE